MTTTPTNPRMDPCSSEATENQPRPAVALGKAYREVPDHMAQDVSKAGGIQQDGDHLIGDFEDVSVTLVRAAAQELGPYPQGPV